jgi:predicted amidohydrolase
MLKIGVTQIKNSANIEENYHTIQKALKVFESTDVDVILFPECALSGFTGKLNGCTLDLLDDYLTDIESWSKRNNKFVFLPTALVSEGKVFNTGFLFGNQKTQRFYKQGLTESELTFFSTPSEDSNKIFTIKGYNLAILICIEAELDPWKFFKEGDADIILWPGYWGWEKGETWKELKKDGEPNLTFENMKKWKVPLIQSNFAFNDLGGHSGAGPHGLSMFVNSDNKLYQSGDFDSESCYEVHISNNEIQNCKKIGDL